ncbi:MAG: hypothetical protein V1773_18050 [bacterium]
MFRLNIDYSKQIMDWYAETVYVLKLLKLLTEKDGTQDNLYIEPLAKLSALIDRGRFIFPNIDKKDDFGKKKPLAFRGYRNVALDFLVASYSIYNNPQNRKKRIAQAEELSRFFSSIVFDVVRPTDNLRQIKKITDKYFVKEEIFEDFIKNEDSKILMSMWE